MPNKTRTFASDNYSPVDPRVLEFLTDINAQGHAAAYGSDPVTAEADRLFRDAFGGDTRVLYVPHGTGANILALKIMLRHDSDAVIMSRTCHIYEMEAGGLGTNTGAQMFTVPHTDGKISVATLEAELANRRNRSFHSARPAVVSIANATELGTAYRPEEVRDIAAFCHENDMLLHMDGCRLPNAAASQGLSLRQASRDLGVDILSFGGAKNGLMNVEAVLIFDTPPSATIALKRQQKQALQLVSKQRYLAGQFVPYLKEGIWLENARLANAAATSLADGLRRLGRTDPGIRVTRPTDTNQVFCTIPAAKQQALRDAGHVFCDWISPGEVRFIASWDNTSADVDGLLAVLRQPSVHLQHV